MQGVLCIVFGGSVALAALLTHQRKLQGNTHLGGARSIGNISVRLPASWRLEAINHGDNLCIAAEPNTADKKGRKLIIRRFAVDPAVTSAEFLETSGLLDGTVRMVPADPGANVADPLIIANCAGVMLQVKRPQRTFLFMRVNDDVPELIAVSVRPSGLAISLQLECPEETEIDNDDEETLREIAAAIEVRAPDLQK